MPHLGEAIEKNLQEINGATISALATNLSSQKLRDESVFYRYVLHTYIEDAVSPIEYTLAQRLGLRKILAEKANEYRKLANDYKSGLERYFNEKLDNNSKLQEKIKDNYQTIEEKIPQ